MDNSTFDNELNQALAQGFEPALPVANPGEHPRLLTSPAYILQTLRPRMKDNTPIWQAFQTYLDSSTATNDIGRIPAATARSYALGWLVTGERLYQDNALQAMQALVNQVESAPVMSQPDEQWDVAFLEAVAGLALAYDWMYEVLTEEDRAIIEDVLLRAAERLRDPTSDTGRVWVPAQLAQPDAAPDDYLFRATSHEDALWLWSLTATALALWGERPEAAPLVDEARRIWLDYALPALEIQPIGAWTEGPYYGFSAIWWKAQTALAWWTALGENYFDDTDWWLQRLAYHLYLRYPEIKYYNNDLANDAFWGYPRIIGPYPPADDSVGYGRAQDLLLSAAVAGNISAEWMNWFLRQGELTTPDWLLSEEFLWRNPDVLGEIPQPLTTRSPGTNHIFMRSNWASPAGELDPNATVITFHAGDHISHRQFFDQGSFTLWRAGDELVVHGGISSPEGASWHEANYTRRTIAANTLRICDLSETFAGITRLNDAPANIWLNDCGQRATSPGNFGAINAQYWAANRIRYDTADILRFADEAPLTYIRADLTAAYNSTRYTTPNNEPKVTEVWRELVYIRPGILLLHDRVTTLSPEFTTIQTLHFNSQPERESEWWTVPGANSTLYLNQMVPGGMAEISNGYLVAGQMVDTVDGEAIENPIGQYQMDTFPPEPDTEPWFLTVLVAEDADERVPPPARPIEGESMRGVMVTGTGQSWQVMFDDDPQDVSRAEFVILPEAQTLLLTGLAPETAYQYTWGDGSSGSDFSNGAGILVLNAPIPGEFIVRQED